MRSICIWIGFVFFGIFLLPHWFSFAFGCTCLHWNTYRGKTSYTGEVYLWLFSTEISNYLNLIVKTSYKKITTENDLLLIKQWQQFLTIGFKSTIIMLIMQHVISWNTRYSPTYKELITKFITKNITYYFENYWTFLYCNLWINYYGKTLLLFNFRVWFQI